MKIVFTNGCFDILHLGHIELLKYSKSLGDKLVVGLNSDKSVRALKGETRPVNNEITRKRILESIKYVDEVIIFDDLTPLNLIKDLKPSIIVKGGDYKPEQVVGYGLSDVIIFNYLSGHSTTATIERMKR